MSNFVFDFDFVLYIYIVLRIFGSQSNSSYGNGGQVDIVPRGPSPPQQRERAEGMSNIRLVAIDETSFQTNESAAL